MPLGAAFMGLIGELAGLRAAFAVFALATAFTIVPFLRTVTPARLKA